MAILVLSLVSLYQNISVSLGVRKLLQETSWLALFLKETSPVPRRSRMERLSNRAAERTFS